MEKSKEGEIKMSYKALVCRVNTFPHPDSKYTNIQCASAKGHTVIVSKDVQSGDLGVFFPTDGMLVRDFCLENKLYRKHPDTGNPMSGYFEENGRVKAIKFGGVKSDGFWMPIATFGNVNFADGDEIDSINGNKICEKYYTPATLKAMARNKNKVVKAMLKDKKSFIFPEHYDTAQFKFNYDKIPCGSNIIITEKLHGTSARMALVETETSHFNWLQKTLFKIGFGKLFRFKPKIKRDWEFLVGSRRVVLNNDGVGGFYGSDKFRFNIANQIKPFIMKNEIIYGEIVGFTDTNKPIMNSVSTECLKDKKFTKAYGNQMIFKYGCAVGHCDFYIYRITNLNPDGVEIELSWNQLKKRCKELGVKHVPELSIEILPVSVAPEIQQEVLKNKVEKLGCGESTLDNSHIREGVCVRVENDNGVNVYKYKSWEFGVLEGYLKNDETSVDLEEVS